MYAFLLQGTIKRNKKATARARPPDAVTHPDLALGANLHFEEKAKHMRQLKPNHFFNAKAVGEDCGDENP